MIFAVVVNWDGGEQNLACLASVEDAGIPAERVVFVDNGSADGSLEKVQAQYPELRVHANDTNLGFGAGANQGAKLALEAGASAVFFVNNDVTLPVGSVTRLTEHMLSDPKIGVLGPRVLYPADIDGKSRVWCAGGSMTWRQNLSTLRGHGTLDGPRFQTVEDIDYVAGCAMLVRREVLESVGYFEDAYFAYMEDVDLCLRASMAGWRVLHAGDVACYHAPSSATGGGYNPRRKYMQGVNSIHFLRTYGGAREWLRFVVFDVLTLPLLWLAGLFQGRAKAAIAKGVGIVHGLRGRRVQAEQLAPGASWLW